MFSYALRISANICMTFTSALLSDVPLVFVIALPKQGDGIIYLDQCLLTKFNFPCEQ